MRYRSVVFFGVFEIMSWVVCGEVHGKGVFLVFWELFVWFDTGILVPEKWAKKVLCYYLVMNQ